MMTFAGFEAFLKESFPEVTAEQTERFRLMEEGYRDWNSKINVISRKDIDGLYDHHVLHSLAIAEYLRMRRPEIYSSLLESTCQKKILDLGTGGGFPGIPLAVMFPNARFILCDSVKKKTIVAEEVSKSLGLENVEIVNARAESLPVKFDFVVSRAVASLLDFYPWVRGKFTESILYLKGGDINEEICSLMYRERLRQDSISTWPVDSWLRDDYFSGKFVIDIKR